MSRVFALLGGEPAFSSPLHVGAPNIGNRERFYEYAGKIFDSRRLTNGGPLVEEFARRISLESGVRHCIPVCNATAGLQLAVKALDLQGEVILPAFNFVAAAHVLQWQGVTPVFADVDPVSMNIEPRSVESLITPRTSGLLAVHMWGRVCDVAGLTRIADRHGLKVLYDAAHAFGNSSPAGKCGSFGNAGVFSFHATKFLNSFEGGAVVTDDDGLAEQLRLMANFGFDGYDSVACLGLNAKMSEISAAMGLTGLESMADFLEINRGHYRLYRGQLQGIPGISLLEYEPVSESNCQYIVLRIDAAAAGISRDLLLRVLHAEHVLARRYFWPGIHRMEPYRTRYPEYAGRLPGTELCAAETLCLPTGDAVSGDDIVRVCGLIREAVLRSGELAAQEPLLSCGAAE